LRDQVLFLKKVRRRIFLKEIIFVSATSKYLINLACLKVEAQQLPLQIAGQAHSEALQLSIKSSNPPQHHS
jgi:hypothetical protein